MQYSYTPFNSHPRNFELEEKMTGCLSEPWFTFAEDIFFDKILCFLRDIGELVTSECNSSSWVIYKKKTGNTNQKP